MGKFDFDKHGYNTEQVDKYIDNLTLKYEQKLAEQKDRLISLKTELDMANRNLEEYKDKEKQISRALVMAVEKAEQVEDASKRVYGLEIKRVRLLYNRWEVLLGEIENRYPNVATTGKTKILLKDFKQNINDVLKQNSKYTTVKDDIKATTDDTYIKNILNRMDYVDENTSAKKGIDENKKRRIIEDVQMKISKTPKTNKSAVSTTKELNESIVVKKNDKIGSSLTNFRNRIQNSTLQNSAKKKDNLNIENKVEKEVQTSNKKTKTFSVPKLNKKDEEVNIIDKYLNSDDDEDNAYANIITSKRKKKKELFEFAFPEPNETGYDYKEAIHPTEELDEIMKAFDFYNPNEE